MSRHLHLAEEHEGKRAAQPIMVVLAEERAALRRSLRLILDGEDGVEVVAEAHDLESATEQVHRHGPHLLVLDLQLANGSSLDAVRRLRLGGPGTEIVVLTMNDSPMFAKKATDAGALGYVLKERADTDLPAAIRAAARGEEFLSPALTGRVDVLRRSLDDGLSPREVEVLRLTALGHTSAEMAGIMHLSRRAVESHRDRVYRKLGLKSRAELVGYALGHQLIGA